MTMRGILVVVVENVVVAVVTVVVVVDESVVVVFVSVDVELVAVVLVAVVVVVVVLVLVVSVVDVVLVLSTTKTTSLESRVPPPQAQHAVFASKIFSTSFTEPYALQRSGSSENQVQSEGCPMSAVVVVVDGVGVVIAGVVALSSLPADSSSPSS